MGLRSKLSVRDGTWLFFAGVKPRCEGDVIALQGRFLHQTDADWYHYAGSHKSYEKQRPSRCRGLLRRRQNTQPGLAQFQLNVGL
jgi:hypothetical protein